MPTERARAMISDREIWQAAGAMIKRYGEDAATEAASRADELLVEGDAEGYAIWRRIIEADAAQRPA